MPDRFIPSIDGNRGSFIFVGGLSYIALALSYLIMPTPGREAGFSWLPTVIGPQAFGALWGLAGVAATVIALRSHQHRRAEPAGFTLLMVPPLALSLIFFVSWIVYVLPDAWLEWARIPADAGHPTGWVTTISYLLISGWVAVASRWENPTPVEGVGDAGDSR